MTNTSSSRKRRRRMAREPKPAIDAGQEVTGDDPAPENKAPAPEKEPSKTERVLVLLKRTEGATLDDLVEATGWLPHTTRAALTGLRKKGHAIERTKVEGISRYTLAESAVQ